MSTRRVPVLSPEQQEQAELYLSIRKQEGRLLTDSEVDRLPDFSGDPDMIREWRFRADTAQRFCRYIKAFAPAARILEIGCGNGWFSATIARKNPTAIVLGIDINQEELEQAQRVFASVDNVGFQLAAPETFNPRGAPFDLIFFAASIQYFPVPETTIQNLFELLSTDGEVHILDTHFYTADQLAPAVRRSQQYFEGQGAIGMSRFYRCHSREQIEALDAELLYDPDTIGNKFLRRLTGRRSPFPWFRINASEQSATPDCDARID